MDNEILRYRSVLSYNAEVFLIQHGDLLKAFVAVDLNFASILNPLGTLQDSGGHSHVSLIPFVFLLQRQAQAAFELFSRAQSFQGWLLMRPGIESALIIGKWIDEPKNAKVWQDRLKDRQAYKDTYEGKALRSKSLVESAIIQPVLSRINSNFVHANPDYYRRHLKANDVSETEVAIKVDYIEDDHIQEAHVLAFLHLLILIQENLAGALSKVFATEVAVPSNRASFVHSLAPKAAKLIQSNPESKTILKGYGGWDAA